MVPELVSPGFSTIAETQAAPRPEPGWEAECFDFTVHLARRLGLSAERASYALGEALLRYEPGELALRAVGVSHAPVQDVEDPPRRSGVYPMTACDWHGAGREHLG